MFVVLNSSMLLVLCYQARLLSHAWLKFEENPYLHYTGLFISPSGTSELDCATTKKERAERSISIGTESLKVFFFVLGALAYLQVPPLGGSRDEKWRAQ